MKKNTDKPARPPFLPTILSVFALLFFANLAWGLIHGLLSVFASAAIPYGLTRLMLETLSRELLSAMRWGSIWGLLFAVYGFLYLLITRHARRTAVALSVNLLFWLMTVGVIILLLLGSFEEKLPLPYQEHVTPMIYLSRFIWPFVSLTVMTKPIASLVLLVVSFMPGFGLTLLAMRPLGRKLGDKPFRRVPSLAMTRKAGLILGLVLLIAATAAFSPRILGRPDDKPNVLLISIDTLRADGLGCYNSQVKASPVMDALAKRGVRYENFYSNAPWTLPGHVSMLTGLIPDVHGAVALDRTIPREALMIQEAFKNEGYRTFAITSNFLVSPPYGFKRGFDRFLFKPEAESDWVSNNALRLLKRTDGPWFGFVHFFDPHLPYLPSRQSRIELGIQGPKIAKVQEEMTHLMYKFLDTFLSYDPELRGAVRALYEGEVRDVDRDIKRILEALDEEGFSDNTIIAITADHGEEFGEHGWVGHTVSLYDESLRVPLIIVGPGLPKGEVVTEVYAQQLLPPLLFSLAGIDDPLREMRDLETIKGQQVAYGHTSAFNEPGDAPPRRTFRRDGNSFLTGGKFKYGDKIYNIPAAPELYGNHAERENLLAGQSKLAEQMQDEMLHYLGDQQKRYGVMEGEALSLTTGQEKRLRELGYVN